MRGFLRRDVRAAEGVVQGCPGPSRSAVQLGHLLVSCCDDPHPLIVRRAERSRALRMAAKKFPPRGFGIPFKVSNARDSPGLGHRASFDAEASGSPFPTCKAAPYGEWRQRLPSCPLGKSPRICADNRHRRWIEHPGRRMQDGKRFARRRPTTLFATPNLTRQRFAALRSAKRGQQAWARLPASRPPWPDPSRSDP